MPERSPPSDLSVRRLLRRLATASSLAALAYLWLFTPLSVTTALAAAGRNGLAVLAVLTRIPEAVATVQEEYERTAAERAAFEEFARRLDELQPTAPDAGGGVTRSGLLAEQSSTDDLAAVREAYRETVMAVPHYEEEYDEPLARNMAEEFGAELAAAVERGGELAPPLQAALLEATEEATEERARFLTTLDAEREDLGAARSALREFRTAADRVNDAVDRQSFGGLMAAWDRLDELEADCEALVADRQDALREAGFVSPMALQEYLYAGRSWTHPVIGDALDCLDRVQSVRERVVEAVSRRK